MSSPEHLIENAVNAAKVAVKFDREGQVGPSVYYYEIAAKWLDQAAESVGEDRNEALKKKSFEYHGRAQTLRGNTKQEVERYH